jgi:hypothetical protein
MSARNRSRARQKGRREHGSFSIVPHAVMDSANWHACSGTAIKLLLELARQFRGNNNGDLSKELSRLQKRGWTRGETIHLAARELVHYGLIEMTRQGGMHEPNLYALTWCAVDECGGKLDVPATSRPSGLWKSPQPVFKRPKKKLPCRIPDRLELL